MEKEVKVRRYKPTDFEQVKQWGFKWGADYQKDQLPLIGFIVDGIAAYFLYQTDSSVCWLENMISNRGIDQATKNRALGLLVEATLREAGELGYTIAYATTDIVSVAKRAKENGAIVKPGQVLLIKDLTHRTQIRRFSWET